MIPLLIAMLMATGAGDGPPVAATRPAPGPTTRPTSVMQRQARRFFREGSRLVRVGRYDAAVQNLRVSIQLDPQGSHVATAREYLEIMEREGRGRLALAQDLLEAGRLLMAGQQFEAVAADFAGLEVAADADRALADLKKRPDFIEAQRRDQAHTLLEKARRHDGQDEYYFAWVGYRRVVEAYGETPAGGEARKRLTEMAADPKLAALIRRQKAEHEASEWLALAENYRRGAERFTGASRVRFMARAREYYNRLLTTHPTSRLAARARAGLAKLAELEQTPATQPAP